MMTKAKRIELLEAQLRSEKSKNTVLNDKCTLLERKVEEMTKVYNSIPADCTPGKYCESCAFSRLFYIRGEGYKYLCNKAGTCQHYISNYISKEKKDD